MTTGRTRLTWQILEEDEWDELEQARRATPPFPARRSLWRAWVWRGAAALALAAAISGYGVWRTGQAGLAQVRAEIQHTADRENQAWQQGDVVLATALTDGAQTWKDWRLAQWVAEAEMGIQPRPDEAGVRVQHMELHGDLALVEVIELRQDASGQPVPYRETRAYRQVGPEWLWTAPVPELWGAERTAETEHFRFVYRQRDAAAVAEVMAEIEDLYGGLRRIVGLRPPIQDWVLTVEVVVPAVLHVDVLLDQVEPTAHGLQVVSPFLVAAPAQFTPAEALRQPITGHLSRQVVNEAVGPGLSRCAWQLMAHGLRLWLRRDRGSEQPAQRAALDRDLQRWLAQYSPPGLAGLIALEYNDWSYLQPTRSTCPTDTPRRAAALTVVAYAMDAFGRERLPALVAGLRRYDTWEELIPAVFGASAAEFEADWQAYLAARASSRSVLSTGF